MAITYSSLWPGLKRYEGAQANLSITNIQKTSSVPILSAKNVLGYTNIAAVSKVIFFWKINISTLKNKDTKGKKSVACFCENKDDMVFKC